MRQQAERELLMKERRARIEAEREKEELMQRLQQYEEEAKAANQALVRVIISTISVSCQLS